MVKRRNTDIILELPPTATPQSVKMRAYFQLGLPITCTLSLHHPVFFRKSTCNTTTECIL
jgi:hypothetical protein